MPAATARPRPAGPAAALPLLMLITLLALTVLFLVTMAQGGALATAGGALDSATTHELFHDARHLLGVPCH